MTELEKRAWTVAHEVLTYFSAGAKPSNVDYMTVMGHVRDLVRDLERLHNGCPTGRHFCPCTCQPAVVGRVRQSQ